MHLDSRELTQFDGSFIAYEVNENKLCAPIDIYFPYRKSEYKPLLELKLSFPESSDRKYLLFEYEREVGNSVEFAVLEELNFDDNLSIIK